MQFDEFGRYFAASAQGGDLGRWDEGEAVCPFSAIAESEDELATPLFAAGCNHHPHVGFYSSSYSGWVEEGDFRAKGSSGGLGTWIQCELLRLGLVDYTINVAPSRSGNESSEHGQPMFAYAVCADHEAVRAGAKSRYYPVEMSQVLDQVRRQPGRYAIVGLPCFIRAVRLLQKQDPIFRDRIKFCIGLICGHLKSSRYAESLAWQMGIQPGELESVDFRVKLSDAPADRYATSAIGGDVTQTALTRSLFGADWGVGAFKYKACDFCDDIFAETADLVVGDAWLPQFVADSRGTNLIVVRNSDLEPILRAAHEQGRVSLADLGIEDVVQSQAACIRHRRNALGFRLHLEIARGQWVPPKRVQASKSAISARERKRQVLRMRLRELSHKAFHLALRKRNLDTYLQMMAPLYQSYVHSGRGIISRARQLLKAVAGRVSRTLRR